MKQQKIVNAYKTLAKYENDSLPLDVSLALFKLKKALSEQWEFEIAEEKKIFDKYHPIQTDDNFLKFDKDEDKENFAKDIASLLNMDIEMNDFKKVKIAFGDNFNMSIADIEALEDFIEF